MAPMAWCHLGQRRSSLVVAGDARRIGANTCHAVFDVFVSYTWSDRRGSDRVTPIVAALDAAGLKIWIDHTENRTFESISRGVREGLSSSRVLSPSTHATIRRGQPASVN